jgi:WD40 repeat protein/mono/diheme cytochrome c family protein
MRCFCAAAMLLLSFSNPTGVIAGDTPVSFHRDVMPIFRIHCVSCHQPGKRSGGLDLTSHAALIAGGDSGPVVRLGQGDTGQGDTGTGDGGRLIETICGQPPEMPPEGEPLLPQEVELIRRWVEQGANVDSPANFLARRPAQPPSYRSLPSVHALAFSSDGNLLAVAGRHEILLHHADGSGIADRLLGDSPRLESVVFSRDSSLLVASGGAASEFGEIQIWDTAKRKLINSIKGSSDTFYGVSISHDNRLVAVGGADKLVRVYEVSGGAEVMRCDNHLDWVFGTAFTNDSASLATASRDKAAKLIDVSTGHLIDDINRTRDPLICLARHPLDDLVATGGTEGKIRLFRMEPRGGRLAEGDNKEESFVREFEHMASPIQAVAFSLDGERIACGCLSGEVRIFRTENGQRVTQIKTEAGPVFSVAFTADGNRLATGGFDGRIRFFEAATGKLVSQFDSVVID